MRALAVVAGLVILAVVSLAILLVAIRGTELDSARTACANNLRQLGTHLVARHAQRPFSRWRPWDPREGGVACLACPGDERIDPEDEAWRRRVAALGPDPAAWPEGTTSYAFGDPVPYPLRTDADEMRALACDLRLEHHGDGVNVLYEDGRVEFEERADPGPFRIGPDGPTAR